MRNIENSFPFQWRWPFHNSFVEQNRNLDCWEQWLCSTVGPRGETWTWILFDRSILFEHERDLLAFKLKFGV